MQCIREQTCIILILEKAVTCSHLQALAATCSHLQPLAAAWASGCKWLQVAASACKWLLEQVAASGCAATHSHLPPCAILKKSEFVDFTFFSRLSVVDC